MWSGLCLSSWTRCCRHVNHCLWLIPEFSHLLCYNFRNYVHHGYRGTHWHEHVTISVTNWVNYLSGWGLGNSILQLVIETLLFRSAHLWCVHWEEGENCLTDDQLEKNYPVRNVLNFNNFVCQFSAKSMPACAQKNLNFQSLFKREQTWLGSKVPVNLCSCTPQVSPHHPDRVSTNSASLPLRVPCGSSDIGLGLFHLPSPLNLLGLLSFLGLGWGLVWLAPKTRLCFPRPIGSQIRDATSIPS